MRALTEIRPWDFAIVRGLKPEENRSWAPPDAVLGSRIATHAGLKYSAAAAGAIDGLTELGAAPSEAAWPGGFIVGTVRIEGWVEHDGNGNRRLWRGVPLEVALAALKSPWVSSKAGFAWLLRDPIALTHPVACRGAQGLWVVPPAIEALVTAQLARASDGGQR